MSPPLPQAQPAKRRKTAHDFSSTDFSCLFRGHLESDEIVRLLCVAPCIADWKMANWLDPNQEMRVVEAEQPAMADDGPRPGTCPIPQQIILARKLTLRRPSGSSMAA